MADSEDRLEGVPEMPEGKIPIQAPPNQAEAAGIGNVLAMVVPMMGSMGRHGVHGDLPGQRGAQVRVATR